MKKHFFSCITVACFLFALNTVYADPSQQTDSNQSSIGFRNGFADIVEPRLDAVVNISAPIRQTQQATPDLQLPEGPLGEFFRDFFSFYEKERSNKSSKVISLGSGFIIDPSGYIVTNYHVIKHALAEKGKITVIFNSGQETQAKIVGADSRSDLALLKVTTLTPLPYLKWGDSSKERVGNWVLAIGNPYGLGGTVTSGIVSTTKRDLAKMEDTTHVDTWIQTDAPVNQGSSGGPLLNIKGEVIGINTAIFTPTGGNIGIAFAIPSTLAKGITEQLKQNGHIQRGWIGVIMGMPLSNETAKSVGLPEAKGSLVSDIIPGSPADKAGLKPGDIILKVSDIAVKNPNHLREIVSKLKPGETISINIWRNRKGKAEKNLTVSLKVSDLEKDYQPTKGSSLPLGGKRILGLTLMSPHNLPSEYHRKFGWEEKINNGIAIIDIDPSSPAFEKLQNGDIILQIGQEPVTTPGECIEIISEAQKNKQESILILILRPEDGRKYHVTVPLSYEASNAG